LSDQQALYNLVRPTSSLQPCQSDKLSTTLATSSLQICQFPVAIPDTLAIKPRADNLVGHIRIHVATPTQPYKDSSQQHCWILYYSNNLSLLIGYMHGVYITIIQWTMTNNLNQQHYWTQRSS